MTANPRFIIVRPNNLIDHAIAKGKRMGRPISP